jgi:hypothetical protein
MTLTILEFWKFEKFQICIGAAPSALRHASVLFSVHYGPLQIHYSLKIVIKIFPIRQQHQENYTFIQF